MGNKKKGKAGKHAKQPADAPVSHQQLATLDGDVLQARAVSSFTVGSLERALLELFPAAEAESWDHTGLLVGDPNAPVEGVVVALDVTVEAIRLARACGANVLLTHHPAFLQPPTRFIPCQAGAYGSEGLVWEALSQGVSLMNFHTALDVSHQAAAVLPGMLHLQFRNIVEPIAAQPDKGYGQLCTIGGAGSQTLRTLAVTATAVFGRMPRVWGDMDSVLTTVVTATGSAGDLSRVCAENGYDCLVAGEVRYHDALAASQAGLCIVELGHDVSELPLCAVLAAALDEIGLPDSLVNVLDQSGNWQTPEATRK